MNQLDRIEKKIEITARGVWWLQVWIGTLFSMIGFLLILQVMA